MLRVDHTGCLEKLLSLKLCRYTWSKVDITSPACVSSHTFVSSRRLNREPFIKDSKDLFIDLKDLEENLVCQFDSSSIVVVKSFRYTVVKPLKRAVKLLQNQ